MTYQITKLLMILAGTWQLELGDVSKTWKIIYKIYSFILFIPYHAGPIMFLLKFYQLLGVDNDKAVECLSMLITVILLVIKMTLCKSKVMTSVLQHSIEKVDEALKNGDETTKSVYNNYMQFANRLNILLTLWSFLVGVYLTIAAIIEDVDYLKTHETTNDDMPLQVLFWYPFPYYEHYKIMLAYQSFSVLSSDLYNSYLQALPNTIMTQITAELKILHHNIKNFTRDDVTGEELSREKAYFKLRGLIVEHQNTIDQISKLNRALRMNLLIEYAVSSVMLASILVQIISGKKVIFNCIYFGALAFGWFMLSYNANEIQFQSTNLSMALYESNWYKQDKRTNQLVFILLMRTQKPLYVQIGLFGPMTIDAAISRFKLAYSYVSVMSP